MRGHAPKNDYWFETTIKQSAEHTRPANNLVYRHLTRAFLRVIVANV